MNGGLAHGLSGVPFWSHDTGGFAGKPSDELFLRWTQFGALSPLLRFHGTTSREPWRFPAVEADVVEALKLRYRLLPYIYSAALRSGETGEPIMRALMVDSPADPAAWRAEHVYRLGPDLLVAPVLSADGIRSFYLPHGQWVDWWEGTVVDGGTYITVEPARDRFPLFAALGTMLPTAPDAPTIPDGPWPSVTLLSIGGLSGTTEIRDDDGVTSVTAVREDATFTVTTSGPARISRVRFARVAGHADPSVVVINGTIQEQ
jgi:alpha-D-xyloside xylohydrolase